VSWVLGGVSAQARYDGLGASAVCLLKGAVLFPIPGLWSTPFEGTCLVTLSISDWCTNSQGVICFFIMSFNTAYTFPLGTHPLEKQGLLHNDDIRPIGLHTNM
jgi:hypothetical protein